MKKSLEWGKHRDPGYEYPSDIRLDDFEGNGDEENMADNVNRFKRHVIENTSHSAAESADDIEEVEPTPPKARSWWSYLLIYNYLH